jgi:hypothetical protein
MGQIDYKKKYMEIRSILVNSVDQAFKAGYQQGSKDAQVEAMQQQAEMQAQQMAAMQGGMQPGMDDGTMTPEEQQGQVMDGAADAHFQDGSNELENGMAELEQELSKAEFDKQAIAAQLANLTRSLNKIKEANELKKSSSHIKKIKNAHNKLSEYSLGYKKNLSTTHKKAVSAQQNIVEGILKKWEAEETKVAADILDVLSSENKVK